MTLGRREDTWSILYSVHCVDIRCVDKVSFRLSVVSIKYRSIGCRWDWMLHDEMSSDQVSTPVSPTLASSQQLLSWWRTLRRNTADFELVTGYLHAQAMEKIIPRRNTADFELLPGVYMPRQWRRSYRSEIQQLLSWLLGIYRPGSGEDHIEAKHSRLWVGYWVFTCPGNGEDHFEVKHSWSLVKVWIIYCHA